MRPRSDEIAFITDDRSTSEDSSATRKRLTQTAHLVHSPRPLGLAWGPVRPWMFQARAVVPSDTGPV